MQTVFYSMPLDELSEIIKKCIREEMSLQNRVTEEDELLRIDQAVDLFRVSKVTLYKWRQKGILPFSKVCSVVYFKRSDIKEILEAKGKNNLKTKK